MNDPFSVEDHSTQACTGTLSKIYSECCIELATFPFGCIPNIYRVDGPQDIPWTDPHISLKCAYCPCQFKYNDEDVICKPNTINEFPEQFIQLCPMFKQVHKRTKNLTLNVIIY